MPELLVRLNEAEGLPQGAHLLPDGDTLIFTLAGASTTTSQFWDRARNVIANQGPSGERVAQMLQQTRDVAERTAGDWTLRLKSARSLSNQEFEQLVDVLEGKATPLSPKIAQAAMRSGVARKELDMTAYFERLEALGKKLI